MQFYIWQPRQADKLDYPKIQNFFLSLDAKDRYAYYGTPTSDDVINRHWERFNSSPGHHFFIVEDQNQIVGVCHVAHANNQVEIGLIAHVKYRNQGIATKLIERAVTWCKTERIENIFVYHAIGNNSAVRLIQRYGLTPLILGDGAEAKFVVPKANLLDYQKEWISKSFDYYTTLFKRIKWWFDSMHPTNCIKP